MMKILIAKPVRTTVKSKKLTSRTSVENFSSKVDAKLVPRTADSERSYIFNCLKEG